ncbi:kinase-like domain-containing protein [Whalleya microplaca]|nr:kinase-like domain-containing protein [Whalleya microplaca]
MQQVSEFQTQTKVFRSSKQEYPEIFGGSTYELPVNTRSNLGARRTNQNLLHATPSLVEESTTLSDATVATPYTIVIDGGQGQAERSGKPPTDLDLDIAEDVAVDTPVDLLSSSKDDGPPFVDVIRSVLYEARLQSAHGSDNWFIPKRKLQQEMRLEKVSLLLKECGSRNEWDRVQLARKICDEPLDSHPVTGKSYRAVFAVLIRIGQHVKIHDFIKDGIHDSVLPLQRPHGRNRVLALKETPTKALDVFKGWQREDIDNFYRVQWEVSPAFFAKEGKKLSHYSFLPGHILPFVHTPAGPVGEEDAGHMRGHYGKLLTYNLHVDQQSLDRHTTDGASGRIAVKELNSESKEMFHNEADVLMRLTVTRNQTPHLAKLLASYQQPSGPDDGSLKFFLMFERAYSNLEQFWANRANSPDRLKVEYGLSDAQVAHWVLSQCVGLAEALATLHDLPKTKEKEDIDQGFHGIHGDIKPRNILRYTNWKDPQSPESALYAPLGILQITDFGVSGFHHTETVKDIRDNVGNYPYKPPESQMIFPISQSLDIWALGCLFLDFVTWLVKGPKGLEEFEKERKKYKGLINNSHSCFYEVRCRKQSTTRVQVSRAVLEWVKKLCNSRRSSQFVCDLAEIVLSRMLVVEDKLNLRESEGASGPFPNRIKASELLTELQKLTQRDDDYLTKINKRPEIHKYNNTVYFIEMRKTIEQVTEDAEIRRTQTLVSHSSKAQLPRNYTSDSSKSMSQGSMRCLTNSTIHSTLSTLPT